MANFKANFKKGQDEYLCPLDSLHEDSQENFLKCQVIQYYLPEIETSNINYYDIFSNNPLKNKITMEFLNKAYKIRENLLEIKNKEQND